MSNDMLVKLYQLPERDVFERMAQIGVSIKRAMALDKDKILGFVRTHFPGSPGWANECERALYMDPISCHIAVKDKQVIGFACYNATAKGVFGPLGVAESERNQRVGEALVRSCMISMRELGYAYAIIGWTGAYKFYERAVGAVVIEGTPPETTVYKNLVSM